MLIDPALYVSIGTAAALADVTRHWMRVQAIQGKVAAVQIDGQWFVMRSAAEQFKRHPTAGRPRAATSATKAAPKRRRRD